MNTTRPKQHRSCIHCKEMVWTDVLNPDCGCRERIEMELVPTVAGLDLGKRADAILRQGETPPEVIIGDPKTGAAFALGPAPHVHGVWRCG